MTQRQAMGNRVSQLSGERMMTRTDPSLRMFISDDNNGSDSSISSLQDTQRQQYFAFDNSQLSSNLNGSPAQAKRALQAHLVETTHRLQKMSHLGSLLLQQRNELEESLKEVEEQEEGTDVTQGLRQRLAELEKEFNVERESAQVFLLKPGDSSGKTDIAIGALVNSSEAHPSPSEIGVPSRNQRKQQPTPMNDIALATEISTALLVQLKDLQANILEKDEALKSAELDRSKLEIELKRQLHALEEKESQFQDTTRAVETQIRHIQHLHAELNDIGTVVGDTTLQAPHSERTEDAYNSDELLLSVQEDWSGRGSQIEFKRGETIPLKKGRVLGYGINGEVVEAMCKGVKIAWKKIYHRNKIQIGQMKEVDVLKNLKHRHIIKLVGTYIQQPYLGLLLWPVARCDLALVLEFMEMDGFYDQSSTQVPGLLEKLSEHDLKIEEVRDIVGVQDERIWSSFGCLTRAMAYLHENNIRHKDVKPSNILLSRDGIWITDFGSAKDFTANYTSTSESRERGTLRYCAPEVSKYHESGRSADMFSLGCVFLEMVVVLSHSHTLADLSKLCPLNPQSYEANLEYINQWLALAEPTKTKTQHLLDEIKHMLSHDRKKRPTAKALTLRLSIIDKCNTHQRTKWLHGPCCDLWRELKVYKERIERLEDDQRKHRK
jgi:serine/threonine protein kinase